MNLYVGARVRVHCIATPVGRGEITDLTATEATVRLDAGNEIKIDRSYVDALDSEEQ